MAASELKLRGGDVERCLRSKSSGLDFDVPLVAVGVVTVMSTDRAEDSGGENAVTEVAELTT